jgi:hypothetical protein
LKPAGGRLGASIVGWSLASAAFAGGDTPKPDAPVRHPKEFKIERFQWTAEPSLVVGIKRIELRNDYGDVRARVGIPGMLEVHSVLQRLGTGPDDVGVNVIRHEEVLAITVTYPPARVVTAAAAARTDRPLRHGGLRAPTWTSPNRCAGIVETRNLHRERGADLGEIASPPPGHPGAVRRSITGVPKDDGRSGVSLLESETGTVSVTFPSGSDVDVRAQTGGKITGNLPVQVESDSSRRRLTFRSGPGSHALFIRSQRGDVEFYQTQP